jgi:NADH dehydrogenase (ubiquinone) 1 beta subcomplex subunit 8
MTYNLLTRIQMISRRIATARSIRGALPVARRVALVQQRGLRTAPEYPKLVSSARWIDLLGVQN